MTSLFPALSSFLVTREEREVEDCEDNVDGRDQRSKEVDYGRREIGEGRVDQKGYGKTIVG